MATLMKHRKLRQLDQSPKPSTSLRHLACSWHIHCPFKMAIAPHPPKADPSHHPITAAWWAGQAASGRSLQLQTAALHPCPTWTRGIGRSGTATRHPWLPAPTRCGGKRERGRFFLSCTRKCSTKRLPRPACGVSSGGLAMAEAAVPVQPSLFLKHRFWPALPCQLYMLQPARSSASLPIQPHVNHVVFTAHFPMFSLPVLLLQCCTNKAPWITPTTATQ